MVGQGTARAGQAASRATEPRRQGSALSDADRDTWLFIRQSPAKGEGDGATGWHGQVAFLRVPSAPSKAQARAKRSSIFFLFAESYLNIF